MPSRMERYYQTEVDVSKRTRKNQSLYDDIHNSVNYSDVNQISNANEISPAKLNEMLNKDKKPQRRAVYREVPISNPVDFDDDNKNYDIKEALEKAKTSKSSNEYSYHKLKDDQINLLKKIESYKASKQEQDENLNELLNTIANTKLLQQLNDRDLSLDLLGDLKSNDDNTVVGGINSINKVMNDIPKEKVVVEEKNEIDKSFYTSSMSFNEDDFDELKEIKSKLKKNNLMMKLIVLILCIVVIVVVILLVVNLKK